MDSQEFAVRFDARVCASMAYKQHIGLSKAIIRACNHTAWLHGVTAGVAEIVREQYALAEADAAAAAAAGGQP